MLRCSAAAALVGCSSSQARPPPCLGNPAACSAGFKSGLLPCLMAAASAMNMRVCGHGVLLEMSGRSTTGMLLRNVICACFRLVTTCGSFSWRIICCFCLGRLVVGSMTSVHSIVYTYLPFLSLPSVKDVNELSTNAWRSLHYCGCSSDWLDRAR